MAYPAQAPNPTPKSNITPYQDLLPEWKRRLRDRGILQAALDAGITPDGNGWNIPLYRMDGSIAPGKFWKNFDSKADRKYTIEPGHTAIWLPGAADAIRENGIAHVVTIIDALALAAAGYSEIVVITSESKIPDTLYGDLATLGCETILLHPHLDPTGEQTPDKVAAALTGFNVIVRQLPPDLGRGGDLAKLWKRCDFQKAAFNQVLYSLPTMQHKPLAIVQPEKQPAKKENYSPSPKHHAYVEAALNAECDKVRNAPAEYANTQLNTSAFKIGQLLHTGFSRSTAEAALLAAALQRGKSKKEATATIDSGLTAGIAKPREIKERQQQRIEVAASPVLPRNISHALATLKATDLKTGRTVRMNKVARMIDALLFTGGQPGEQLTAKQVADQVHRYKFGDLKTIKRILQTSVSSQVVEFLTPFFLWLELTSCQKFDHLEKKGKERLYTIPTVEQLAAVLGVEAGENGTIPESALMSDQAYMDYHFSQLFSKTEQKQVASLTLARKMGRSRGSVLGYAKRLEAQHKLEIERCVEYTPLLDPDALPETREEQQPNVWLVVDGKKRRYAAIKGRAKDLLEKGHTVLLACQQSNKYRLLPEDDLLNFAISELGAVIDG